MVWIDHYPNPWQTPQKILPYNPGVPVIPPLPNNPANPHGYVAQCGECGRLIPQIDMYSCGNARCPVQPKVTC